MKIKIIYVHKDVFLLLQYFPTIILEMDIFLDNCYSIRNINKTLICDYMLMELGG